VERTQQRRVRWALRGALILAAVAIVLGGIFNVLIALFTGETGAGAGFWAILLLRSSLAWGAGGLFFGALLGMFASMIWRDDGATG
jgi:hypothetical protein